MDNISKRPSHLNVDYNKESLNFGIYFVKIYWEKKIYSAQMHLLLFETLKHDINYAPCKAWYTTVAMPDPQLFSSVFVFVFVDENTG